MADYRTIITTVGQTKLAAAILGPAIVLETMAVGDASGVGYDPDEAQLALVNQIYSAALDSVETEAGGVIVCEMTIPADQGGWHVREACIKDDEGDIIAICRIADRYKPLPASGQADELTIRMKLDVGNVGNVDWVVDLTRKSKIDGQLRPDFRSVEAIQNDPPGAPEPGETWVVGAAPTGAWVGHDNELAEWSGTGWTFVEPTPWMHVGLADRTDWRWDHTVPGWALWKGTVAIAGPVKVASEQDVKDAAGTGVVEAQYLVHYASQLISALTLYVRTDGNDANDGLANTAGQALATVQGAVDRAFSFVAGPHTVTINVATGNYGPVSTPVRPGPTLVIVGDEATPANVLIYGPESDAIAVRGLNSVTVRGVRAVTGLITPDLAGFIAYAPATLDVENCESGPSSGAALQAFGGGSLSVGDHRFTDDAAYLYLSNVNSSLRISGVHTIASVINLSSAVAAASNNATLGVSSSSPVSYVNPVNVVSGLRYISTLNGIINTNGGGATFFPGSGTLTTTGGQYV